MVLLYTMNILSTTKNNKCSNTFYGNFMQERKAAVGRTEGRMVCRACDTQCGRGMTSTLQVFDFHHAFVGLTPLLCPSQTNQIKISPPPPRSTHLCAFCCGCGCGFVYGFIFFFFFSFFWHHSHRKSYAYMRSHADAYSHRFSVKKFVYKSMQYFAPQNFMV